MASLNEHGVEIDEESFHLLKMKENKKLEKIEEVRTAANNFFDLKQLQEQKIDVVIFCSINEKMKGHYSVEHDGISNFIAVFIHSHYILENKLQAFFTEENFNWKNVNLSFLEPKHIISRRVEKGNIKTNNTSIFLELADDEFDDDETTLVIESFDISDIKKLESLIEMFQLSIANVDFRKEISFVNMHIILFKLAHYKYNFDLKFKFRFIDAEDMNSISSMLLITNGRSGDRTVIYREYGWFQLKEASYVKNLFGEKLIKMGN